MMHTKEKVDLQLFAEEGTAPAQTETAAGVSAADAGQETAAQGAEDKSAETPRRSWAEVRAEYKADFDREVQSIVQKRLKAAQEKLRAYEAQGAERAQASTRRTQLAAALRRREAEGHFSALCAQAEALRQRIPDFDLTAELRSDAFAALTRPGSPVSVEMAYWAVHPELRLQEARAVAQRAAEAVSEAVRAGAARPQENGAQSATLSSPSFRQMSREQRAELKRRIYAAGAQGVHLGAEETFF